VCERFDRIDGLEVEATFQGIGLQLTGDIGIFVFVTDMATKCAASRKCVKFTLVGVLLLGLVVGVGCSRLSLEDFARGSCGARFHGEFGWSAVVIGSGETGVQGDCSDFDDCRFSRRMVQGCIDSFCCVWLVAWAWFYAPVSVGTEVFDDLDVAFHDCLDSFKK